MGRLNLAKGWTTTSPVATSACWLWAQQWESVFWPSWPLPTLTSCFNKHCCQGSQLCWPLTQQSITRHSLSAQAGSSIIIEKLWTDWHTCSSTPQTHGETLQNVDHQSSQQGSHCTVCSQWQPELRYRSGLEETQTSSLTLTLGPWDPSPIPDWKLLSGG